MPVFQVDIEKYLAGEYWTNRYFVEEPSLPDAITASDALLQAERGITWTGVRFTKLRASVPGQVVDQFISVPLGESGQFTANAEDIVPLFNVARFNFSRATYGRPLVKLMRGCLTDGDLVYDEVVAAARIRLSAYVTALLAYGRVCDSAGNLILGGAVDARPRARALRRGSKRKQQPVLP